MGNIKSKQQTEQRKQQAYDYFISQGYSPEASAGIVGNLVHESGLDTTIEGDKGYSGGSGFGIAQFRGARLQNLKKKYGNGWSDFNNQLEYVKYELETTHTKANEVLRNTRDVYQAGEAFSDLYEIPAVKYKNNKDRQQKVNSIYTQFVGKEAPSVTQDFTDYEKPIALPNFAESAPDMYELPETPSQEEASKVQAAEENLKQQTNEFNFVKDFFANQQQPIALEEPVVDTRQTPPPSIIGKYAEISNFVTAPAMQKGGTIYVDSKNDPRYRAYKDSLYAYESGHNIPLPVNSTLTHTTMSYPKDKSSGLFDDEHLQIRGLKPIANQTNYFADKSTGNFIESQRVGVYKKPQQKVVVDPTPQVKSVGQLQAQGAVEGNNNISATSSSDYQPTNFQTYGQDNFPNRFLASGQIPTNEERKNNPEWDRDTQIIYLKDPKELGINRSNNGRYAQYNDSYKNLKEGIDFVYMQQGGQVPVSSKGMYDYPNQKVLVPTPNGTITMKNINHPVLGISQETGERKIMMPNLEYLFSGSKNILEIPLKK